VVVVVRRICLLVAQLLHWWDPQYPTMVRIASEEAETLGILSSDQKWWRRAGCPLVRLYRNLVTHAFVPRASCLRGADQGL